MPRNPFRRSRVSQPTKPIGTHSTSWNLTYALSDPPIIRPKEVKPIETEVTPAIPKAVPKMVPKIPYKVPMPPIMRNKANRILLNIADAYKYDWHAVSSEIHLGRFALDVGHYKTRWLPGDFNFLAKPLNQSTKDLFYDLLVRGTDTKDMCKVVQQLTLLDGATYLEEVSVKNMNDPNSHYVGMSFILMIHAVAHDSQSSPSLHNTKTGPKCESLFAYSIQLIVLVPLLEYD